MLVDGEGVAEGGGEGLGHQCAQPGLFARAHGLEGLAHALAPLSHGEVALVREVAPLGEGLEPGREQQQHGRHSARLRFRRATSFDCCATRCASWFCSREATSNMMEHGLRDHHHSDAGGCGLGGEPPRGRAPLFGGRCWRARTPTPNKMPTLIPSMTRLERIAAGLACGAAFAWTAASLGERALCGVVLSVGAGLLRKPYRPWKRAPSASPRTRSSSPRGRARAGSSDLPGIPLDGGGGPGPVPLAREHARTSLAGRDARASGRRAPIAQIARR